MHGCLTALLAAVGPAAIDVIVDAIAPDGATPPTAGEQAHQRPAIEWANGQRRPMVALDVPSGLDWDTGTRLAASLPRFFALCLI